MAHRAQGDRRTGPNGDGSTTHDERSLMSLYPTAPIDWNTVIDDPDRAIPFGVTPDGALLSMDRWTSPHLMVTGGPRTGKTTFLQTHVAMGLVRKEAFIVIDTESTDSRLEFARPWLHGFAGKSDYEGAAALCEAVSVEVARRGDLMVKHKVTRLTLLPDAVRPPTLTLIVAGVQSLTDRTRRPCRCATHRAEDEAAARILGWVGKFSREARFAGVRVIVSGTVSREAARAVGHVDFARLALGPITRDDRQIALHDPMNSPELVTAWPGQGVYEAMDLPAEAVHCWSEPGGVDALRAKLVELAPLPTGA